MQALDDKLVKLPINLISIKRFNRDWLEPAPALFWLNRGERIRFLTDQGSFDFTVQSPIHSQLSLQLVDEGWLVDEPGTDLAQMGLLTGDVIIKLSGASVFGEPPSELQGMLEIRRGQNRFSILAP